MTSRDHVLANPARGAYKCPARLIFSGKEKAPLQGLFLWISGGGGGSHNVVAKPHSAWVLAVGHSHHAPKSAPKIVG